jgi:L-2,4-diaminobutyrate transaminase
MLTNDLLDRWDRESFFHPSTHLGQFARGEAPSRIIKTAEGCHIVDRDGRRLLDAFAGLYCVNVGYGRPEIAEAIADQARELAYYHAYVGHGTEAAITLAHMVLERAPAHMGKVYFGLSGSDANETNVKLVWFYNNILGRPEKKKIISRWRGYHGSGLVTGSLTGLDLFHRKFDLPLGRILHTEAPYYLRRPDPAMSEEAFATHCAERLDELILAEGPDTVAAFIGEPILGTGGIVPPPAGYWEKIQAVLAQTRRAADRRRGGDRVRASRQHDGVGALRAPAGSHHHRQGADLGLCAALGVDRVGGVLRGADAGHRRDGADRPRLDLFGASGGGGGGCREPAADRQARSGRTGGRGRGVPARGAAAALADHPQVAEVRGEGLLAAVELMEEPGARRAFPADAKVGGRIAAEMLARGVIARAMPQGDILGFAPPFCLTRDEADTIVAATRDAVEAVLPVGATV